MKLIVEKNKQGFETPEFREYLKTPVPKSEITTSEADELRKTLESAHKQFGGIGISATQIGIKKRVCYIKFRDTELFLINPFIKERSKDAFLFFEACLSMPRTMDVPLRTIRSSKVTIVTDNMGELEFEINAEGDKEEVSTETMMTVLVQHEIDHLDGITIKDRVYSTTIVNKVNYGRNDKIVMKSPDGDMVEVKYKRANEYFLKGYEIL